MLLKMKKVLHQKKNLLRWNTVKPFGMIPIILEDLKYMLILHQVHIL